MDKITEFGRKPKGIDRSLADLARDRVAQHVSRPIACQPADDVGAQEDARRDEDAVPVDVEAQSIDRESDAVRGLAGDQVAHIEKGAGQKKEDDSVPIGFSFPGTEAAIDLVAGHYSWASCCQTWKMRWATVI